MAAKQPCRVQGQSMLLLSAVSVMTCLSQEESMSVSMQVITF